MKAPHSEPPFLDEKDMLDESLDLGLGVSDVLILPKETEVQPAISVNEQTEAPKQHYLSIDFDGQQLEVNFYEMPMPEVITTADVIDSQEVIIEVTTDESSNLTSTLSSSPQPEFSVELGEEVIHDHHVHHSDDIIVNADLEETIPSSHESVIEESPIPPIPSPTPPPDADIPAPDPIWFA